MPPLRFFTGQQFAENCEAEAGSPAAGKYPAAVQRQFIHKQPLNFLYILYIVQTVTEQ